MPCIFEVLPALNEILTDSVAASNLTNELASCFALSLKMQNLTYLLEELAGDTQHHTAEVLCLSTGEESPEWSVATNVARCTNTVGDDASFEFDLLVFSVVSTKSSQRGYSLVVTISSHEPTR